MSGKSKTSEIRISGSNTIGNIGDVSNNSVVSVDGREKFIVSQDVKDMREQLKLFLSALDQANLPRKEVTYLKEDVEQALKAMIEQPDIERLLEQLMNVNNRLKRLKRNGELQSVASSASLTGFICQVIEMAKVSL